MPKLPRISGRWLVAVAVVVLLVFTVWRTGREPEFPAPAAGYNLKQIDYKRRFPDQPPIVIDPFVVTPIKPAPMKLSIGTLQTWQPVVFTGTITAAPWTVGIRPGMAVSVRFYTPATGDRPEQSRGGKTINERADEESVLNWRLECLAPREPGTYTVRVKVTHYFYEKIEWDPDDPNLKNIDFLDETIIAEGTVIVEPGGTPPNPQPLSAEVPPSDP